MVLVFPSILAADFSALAKEILKVENADALHLDIMDGLFVPNISFGLPVLESLRPLTNLPFDTHLMIQKPELYIEKFIEAGSNSLSFHIEACSKPLPLLKKIRFHGVSPGLAIDFGTPVEKILAFLHELDFVTVLSAKAGFGGQKFQESTLEKIRTIREHANQLGLKTKISVDCGINLETGKRCVEAGADILIAGSSVFKAKNPKEAVAEMQNL